MLLRVLGVVAVVVVVVVVVGGIRRVAVGQVGVYPRIRRTMLKRPRRWVNWDDLNEID